MAGCYGIAYQQRLWVQRQLVFYSLSKGFAEVPRK
jgi:hypothetical protein